MTVMTLTSLLVCLVMLMAWNLHPLLVALFFVVYLPLEGMFLSATLVKVPTGGKYWPLVLLTTAGVGWCSAQYSHGITALRCSGTPIRHKHNLGGLVQHARV